MTQFKTPEECIGHWFTGIVCGSSTCSTNKGFANTAMRDVCKCQKEARDLLKKLDENGYEVVKKSINNQYDFSDFGVYFGVTVTIKDTDITFEGLNGKEEFQEKDTNQSS